MNVFSYLFNSCLFLFFKRLDLLNGEQAFNLREYSVSLLVVNFATVSKYGGVYCHGTEYIYFLFKICRHTINWVAVQVVAFGFVFFNKFIQSIILFFIEISLPLELFTKLASLKWNFWNHICIILTLKEQLPNAKCIVVLFWPNVNSYITSHLCLIEIIFWGRRIF